MLEGGRDHLLRLAEYSSNRHLWELVRFYELAGRHKPDVTSGSQHFLNKFRHFHLKLISAALKYNGYSKPG